MLLVYPLLVHILLLSSFVDFIFSKVCRIRQKKHKKINNRTFSVYNFFWDIKLKNNVQHYQYVSFYTYENSIILL